MNYSSKNTISQQKADGPSDFLGITQSSGLDRHGVIYHGRIRRLTPRECLRLQGRQISVSFLLLTILYP